MLHSPRPTLLPRRIALLWALVAGLFCHATGVVGAASDEAGVVPLYLLAEDGQVLHFDGPGSWSRVGGPFKQLFAGPDRLFALAPSGDIFEYEGSAGWSQIGGPGYSFVVDGQGRLAGITPDRQAVMQYRGHKGGWFRIGNQMAELIGGGDRLYGVTPSGELWLNTARLPRSGRASGVRAPPLPPTWTESMASRPIAMPSIGMTAGPIAGA